MQKILAKIVAARTAADRAEFQNKEEEEAVQRSTVRRLKCDLQETMRKEAVQLEKQVEIVRETANKAEAQDDIEAEDAARGKLKILKNDKATILKWLEEKAPAGAVVAFNLDIDAVRDFDVDYKNMKSKIEKVRAITNNAEKNGDEDAEDAARTELRQLKRDILNMEKQQANEVKAWVRKARQLSGDADLVDLVDVEDKSRHGSRLAKAV